MSKDTDGETSADLLTLTGDIVTAHVSHNRVDAEALPVLISNVYAALKGLTNEPAAKEPEPLQPAVAIRNSVKPDYIVCLEDGKRMTMLKRYLRNTYNMSPQEYRARWNLPADYPMVAPNYATRRSEIARESGLGHKRKDPGGTAS